MDKNELVELIEGPVLKAYYSSGKRNYKDINESKNDIKKNEPAVVIDGEEDRVNGVSTSSTSSGGNFGGSTSNQILLSEAQRDRRTVFVQQLSVRCTDRDLYNFFTENGCSVRHARIVLDKYTRKSKGVAYVEFYEEDAVRAALKLSGKKVVGVPVIVELTETEKNRIAQEAAALNATASATSKSNATTSTTATNDDFVRLYVGALHPSLTELELEQLFEPFGILESVELLKDERTGASKGVAFIQYKKVGGARSALEALNGFELAGRAIRVGPVRTETKSKPSSTQYQQQTSSTSVSKSAALPSQQQQKLVSGEVDEEENITLDANKRAELMQKLLSSRK